MGDTPGDAKEFRYRTPVNDRAKTVVNLARTDRVTAAVQMVRRGGENNLHSHRHLDGVWFVLRGSEIGRAHV